MFISLRRINSCNRACRRRGLSGRGRRRSLTVTGFWPWVRSPQFRYRRRGSGGVACRRVAVRHRGIRRGFLGGAVLLCFGGGVLLFHNRGGQAHIDRIA